MKRLLFLCGWALWLASCSNDRTTEEETPEETEEETAETSETALLRTSFPQLFAYLQNSDSSFAPAGFDMTGTQQLDSSVITPLSEKQTELFRSCLIYSPDSSQAIDLFSYNYVLVPSANGYQAEPGGPDTEAALIDFRQGTRRRIYFTGPSTAMVDAKWLPEGGFLLAGGEVSAGQGFVPFVWKVDPATNHIDVYSYADTLRLSPESYKRSLCSLLK